MSNRVMDNVELWSLFTLEKDYQKETFDKLYNSGDGRDVCEPVISQQVFGKQRKVVYPGNKKFAVCLTHDIDDLYPPLSHKLLSTASGLRNLRPEAINELWFPDWQGENRSPYHNFRHIMDLEESFGARSSFYFLATENDVKRFRYHVEQLESDIGEIADRGWEVGLHGGYYAFDNPEEILKEKRRLDRLLCRPSVGYRNHYLRFKVPNTWHYLSAAGFRYDTTIGFGNAVGFRNGACHPFQPYDLNRKQWLDILEIPLTIMDCNLFMNGRSPVQAFEMSRRIIDRVEQCGGVVTLLWHNTSFGCSFRADWEKLYKKLLGYCRERGAWMTTGEDIMKWAEQGGTESRWERGFAEITASRIA